ncbi:MAG: hypothetical protein Q7R41_19860 [Phycisphaerales bacterium]|nr:hypothetical protein [Phycisphaerales bacterium]
MKGPVQNPSGSTSRKRLPPRRRSINSVYLARLHEVPRTATGIAEAVAFIESFDESKPDAPFTRYEVGVRYNNGNEVRGQFNDKVAAVAFLRSIR